MFIVILGARHAWLNYKFTKMQGKLLKNESFLRSRFSKTMFIEMLFNSIHNVPNVNYVFIVSNADRPVKYSMNAIITFIMLSRMYLVLRLLTRFTKWRSEQAEIIC